MFEKIKNFIFSDEEYDYAEAAYDNDRADEIKPIKLSKLKMTESEVVISEPLSYSESQAIADYVLANRSIIINLHRVTPDQAKRIIDFLSGTVYALNGTIQKIGEEIFLVAPSAVQVSGTVNDAGADIE